MPGMRFKPVADHALLVQVGEEISADTSARVQQLDQRINEAAPKGLSETIPAFVNILVEFDPLVTDHREMQEAVQGLSEGEGVATGASRVHEVPVCYDDEFAPDLDAVANASGLSRDAVIQHHLSGNYNVALYGFAPGYAYLAGVPDQIQVPRKPAILRDVPAGSILIAGPQCLITPLTMPTGWSIIGRSSVRVLNEDREDPFLFDVGDQVQFHRVDADTLRRQERIA